MQYTLIKVLFTKENLTRILFYITEINLRRVRPARPNNAIIDEATVSSVSSTAYEVTLKPFECGSQFPLFEIVNGRVCCCKRRHF